VSISNAIVVPAPPPGAYLWDVDLTTNLTHSWCGDVAIELTDPSGRRVTITENNAEGFADVFAGTRWDDSAANPAFSYAYTSHVTAPALEPEGALRFLNGSAIAGSWTLHVSDDFPASDNGVLASWKLDITYLSAAPIAPSTPQTFTRNTSLAIVDNATVSDSQMVSGLTGTIADLRLRTDIAHTWNADLVIELVAPSLDVVRLSTFNGGEYDDVFAGTDFDDRSVELADPLHDQVIALYPFVDGVAATSVCPEGKLGRLIGQDPNGLWTLRIQDTAAQDTGALHSWELTVSTYAATAPPISYCTAGTTTNACLATISTNANPSAAQLYPCNIAVANVEGQKLGMIFYGVDNSGYAPVPWGSGSTSFFCVKSPTQRAIAQLSGGTANACDGVLALDLDAFLASHAALGEPFGVGDRLYVQAWFRDPPAPRTTSLSNALELTFQP
jgi:subtilisin-like proprotein convertase family protein